VVDRWISYRTFWFDSNADDLRSSDTGQVSEIAYYMQQNPSLKVGIDGSIPSGSDTRNQDLAGRRVSNVYDALIEAGVPGYRIETGAFGDAQLARQRRVEVLLRTSD
jgi:outer membrane protein OmpA-like peptidoglycan-associated protein